MTVTGIVEGMLLVRTDRKILQTRETVRSFYVTRKSSRASKLKWIGKPSFKSSNWR
jgi:hypothetical protein